MTSAAVRAAHQDAVGQALQYLESVAGHALRGHQGDGQRADRIGTDGWIAAAFEHRTSRAGDPQLHTHLVVPNLLRGSDGKWSAIDSRAVFRHTHTASYVYHAVLRGELTKRLGVGWTAPVKGVAEIAGLPTTCSTPSPRDAGRSWPPWGRPAGPGRRPHRPPAWPPGPPKPPAEPERPSVSDGSQLPSRRPPAPGVVGAVLGRLRPPVRRRSTARQHLLGPAGLTAQATGFDRRDLLQALCQALPPGQAVDRARLERPQIASWTEPGRSPPCCPLRGRPTLVHNRAAGRRAGRAAPPRRRASITGQASRSGGCRPRTSVAGCPKSSSGWSTRWPWPTGWQSWSDRPVPARPQHLRPPSRLALTGQTGARSRRRGRDCTSPRACDRHESSSLTRLLHDARRTDPTTGRAAGLPRGGVVVVDEASMVDTRTLADLLRLTQAAGGTLVLVGDPAQLPEVGAGGLFTALARHPEHRRPHRQPPTGRTVGASRAERPAGRRPRRSPGRVLQP